jgi:hypothetical protein
MGNRGILGKFECFMFINFRLVYLSAYVIVRELVHFCDIFYNSKNLSSWTFWRSKLAIFRVP